MLLVAGWGKGERCSLQLRFCSFFSSFLPSLPFSFRKDIFGYPWVFLGFPARLCSQTSSLGDGRKITKKTSLHAWLRVPCISPQWDSMSPSSWFSHARVIGTCSFLETLVRPPCMMFLALVREDSYVVVCCSCLVAVLDSSLFVSHIAVRPVRLLAVRPDAMCSLSDHCSVACCSPPTPWVRSPTTVRLLAVRPRCFSSICSLLTLKGRTITLSGRTKPCIM